MAVDDLYKILSAFLVYDVLATEQSSNYARENLKDIYFFYIKLHGPSAIW